MYTVSATKSLDKALAKLPGNWQKRIVAKIKEVAVNPYAPNNNVTKLQGREPKPLPDFGIGLPRGAHSPASRLLSAALPA
jgi:hypothetical protein